VKYFSAGQEEKERVMLFLDLTKITSEPIVKAMLFHLVNGFTENNAARIAGTSVSNFNRAMIRINNMAEKYEKIKEYDLSQRKR
jgi:hypothetical protein